MNNEIRSGFVKVTIEIYRGSTKLLGRVETNCWSGTGEAKLSLGRLRR